MSVKISGWPVSVARQSFRRQETGRICLKNKRISKHNQGRCEKSSLGEGERIRSLWALRFEV